MKHGFMIFIFIVVVQDDLALTMVVAVAIYSLLRHFLQLATHLVMSFPLKYLKDHMLMLCYFYTRFYYVNVYCWFRIVSLFWFSCYLNENRICFKCMTDKNIYVDDLKPSLVRGRSLITSGVFKMINERL